jgi:excisionase family DNA binding protein
MNAQSVQLNPTVLTDEQVKMIAFTVAAMVKSELKDFLMDKPMTIKEAAEFLNYSEVHIRRFCASGSLPSYRVEDGGELRLIPSEIIKKLKSH